MVHGIVAVGLGHGDQPLLQAGQRGGVGDGLQGITELLDGNPLLRALRDDGRHRHHDTEPGDQPGTGDCMRHHEDS
jgi:hypothetical protein